MDIDVALVPSEVVGSMATAAPGQVMIICCLIASGREWGERPRVQLGVQYEGDLSPLLNLAKHTSVKESPCSAADAAARPPGQERSAGRRERWL